MRSYNGPQFVAAEFEGFLEYLGIQHMKGVPYWPQSNGEVERFNETMMKAINIAKIEKKHWKEELQNFLFQYLMTPHTVTGVNPAEMLMGRKLRNKLPKMQMRAEPMDELQWQMQIRERDARRKRYEKEYADKKRGAKVSDIEVGDRVILRQSKRNKLTTPFEREPYEVVDHEDNAVVIQRGEEPRKMRNVAHMKKLNSISETSDGQTLTPVPVNVGGSDVGREPAIMEDMMVELAKPDPETPPMVATGAYHTYHARCPIYTTIACSIRTNMDERLCEEIDCSCLS